MPWQAIASALVVVVTAAYLLACMVVSSITYVEPSSDDVSGFPKRDNDFLTAEEQRLLVRNGEVTVFVNGVPVTVKNNEGSRIYLTEGGVR